MAAFLITAPAARTDVLCSLIKDTRTGQTLLRTGDGCGRRVSPGSTFKLPLAVIGFETGLLQSPDAPARPYDPRLGARYAMWRRTTTPRTWLRDSVVWYSQWLTGKLGAAALQRHVDRLGYGNRDLSGDPGQDNGLTHAWLGSSLAISPEEQIALLQALDADCAGYQAEACASLAATLPEVKGGKGLLSVRGKTGTVRRADSTGVPRLQIGWFIGWAQTREKRLAFVHLTADEAPNPRPAGPRARDAILPVLAQAIGFPDEFPAAAAPSR